MSVTMSAAKLMNAAANGPAPDARTAPHLPPPYTPGTATNGTLPPTPPKPAYQRPEQQQHPPPPPQLQQQRSYQQQAGTLEATAGGSAEALRLQLMVDVVWVVEAGKQQLQDAYALAAQQVGAPPRVGWDAGFPLPTCAGHRTRVQGALHTAPDVTHSQILTHSLMHTPRSCSPPPYCAG